MIAPTRNDRVGARTAFAGLEMRKWPWKIFRAKKKKKKNDSMFLIRHGKEKRRYLRGLIS